MIGIALAGLLVASQTVPAGDIVPEAGDFRLQTISRVHGENEWPFISESGMLACTKILGESHVYFLPDGEYAPDKAYILDVNIMAMSIVNLGVTNVLLPFDTPEQLLTRIVPFVTMGQRLCNLEPGTVLSGSEL